jgi:kynurenine formamidase
MIGGPMCLRRRVAFPTLLLLVVGCASREPSGLDLSRARVLDLTYAFGPKTVYWPTEPLFQRKDTFRGKTRTGFFYAAGSYAASEHGGTHMDAPVHFAERGVAAHEIPPSRLVGPAWVLDARTACAKDPDHLVSRTDFEEQVKRTGPPPEGAVVILLTGWGRYWPDRKSYLGDDRPLKTDGLSFPGLDPDLASLLVERGVKAVGIDTASIDRGRSTHFESHQVLAAAQVPVYENVAHADALPPVGAWVVAAPMKIEGGSGGPLRVLALLPAKPDAPRAIVPPEGKVAWVEEALERLAPEETLVVVTPEGTVTGRIAATALQDELRAAELEAALDRAFFRLRFDLGEGEGAWRAPPWHEGGAPR